MNIICWNSFTKKNKNVHDPEQSTAFALYENNQLDLIDNRSFPTTEIERFKTSHCVQYHQSPLLRVSYIGFNIEKRPFDNVQVRKAISFAIDRNDYAEF